MHCKFFTASTCNNYELLLFSISNISCFFLINCCGNQCVRFLFKAYYHFTISVELGYATHVSLECALYHFLVFLISRIVSNKATRTELGISVCVRFSTTLSCTQ